MRESWPNRASFLVTCMGFTIGIGNIWRFPYLMTLHGGVLFMIPYFLALFFIGIPMTLLEIGVGQYFQRGNIESLKGIHPRLGGIGIAATFTSFIILVYYVVIIAWSLVYIVKCF